MSVGENVILSTFRVTCVICGREWRWRSGIKGKIKLHYLRRHASVCNVCKHYAPSGKWVRPFCKKKMALLAHVALKTMVSAGGRKMLIWFVPNKCPDFEPGDVTLDDLIGGGE